MHPKSRKCAAFSMTPAPSGIAEGELRGVGEASPTRDTGLKETKAKAGTIKGSLKTAERKIPWELSFAQRHRAAVASPDALLRPLSGRRAHDPMKGRLRCAPLVRP